MKEYDIFLIILLIFLYVFDFLYLGSIIVFSYVMAKIIHKFIGGDE